jgi:signal transduction histidine kinase
VLEVDDDGVGLPAQARLGVGRNSMRERAEELGGTCQVAIRPEGGTRVSASLPFTPAE